MIKIAIDLDMTLVDHVPYMTELFERRGLVFAHPSSWSFDNYPDDIKKEIITDFMNPDCRIVTTKFPVFPGVVSTLFHLDKMGDYHLEIVSARTNSKRNMEYIKYNFPMVDKITLLESNGSDNKFKYINNNYFDYWIDDYPVGYEKVSGCNIILISNENTPYNYFMRKDLKFIRNFNEITWRYI